MMSGNGEPPLWVAGTIEAQSCLSEFRRDHSGDRRLYFLRRLQSTTDFARAVSEA